MEKQNKTFLITLIIFIVAVIIALCLILSKGKIFGFSLVKTENVNKKVSSQDVELISDKEFLSEKDAEEATLSLVASGEEITEKVEYTSSNEDAIVVENGVARAVGVGEATITAKYEDTEATVKLNAITPITKMTFTTTSSSIRVGNQLQVKLQLSPSDASIDTISYSSSDENIATVNKNGIVTGVSKGKVTITVSDSYTGEEKSVKLTIR